MTISADELLGLVRPTLDGTRRRNVTTDRAREAMAEERLRRAQARAKSKAWRKANLDAVKAYMAAWRRENRAKVRAYNEAWKAKNPERVKELRREWNARYAAKSKNEYSGFSISKEK